MRRGLLLCVMLMGEGLVVTTPTAAQAQDVDFTQSLVQGKILLKNQQYREAIKELRKALSTPEGDKNFEAHFLYSQATFRNHDIAQAIDFAQRSMELAKTDAERQQAQDFYTYLTTAFGKVEFIPGENELAEGYIFLEPQEPILDPDVKRYYEEKVVPVYTQKRSSPWVMWLPAISFKFNGQEFTVKAGGESTQINAGFTPESVAAMETQVNKLRSKQEEAQRQDLGFLEPRPDAPRGIATELRGGVTALLGQPAGTLMAPTVDLTVRKEMGRLGGAVFGSVSLMNVDLSDPRTGYVGSQSVTDYTAGALATVRVWLPAGLALLPGLGLGYGTAGGYIAYCDVAQSDFDSASNTVVYDVCSTAQDGMTDPVMVHLQTKGVGPVGRLDLLYEKRIGIGYLGAHLDLTADMLMASPPQDATRDASPYNQEVIFADAGVTRVIRAGAMVGLNLAF